MPRVFFWYFLRDPWQQRRPTRLRVRCRRPRPAGLDRRGIGEHRQNPRRLGRSRQTNRDDRHRRPRWIAPTTSAKELRSLFIQLRCVESRLRNYLDARLTSECGLVVDEFELLTVIDGRGRCRVRDLADVLFLSTGDVSTLVGRLESAGLCRKRPDTGERRTAIVELTPQGKVLLSLASETVENALHAQIGPVLSSESLRRVATLLQVLENARTLGT